MIWMTCKTWTCGVCESCLKNAHEEIKMIEQTIISGDPKEIFSKEIFVCPKCGATKTLRI